MQLNPNTLLQGGKYRIIRVLGQGGFGITYEAEQVSLARKVAVKEFFMKDCCERKTGTRHISIPTRSNRSLVERFLGKFVKEARMLASFDHPHIIRVLDVFEENGTAYYVMEYLSGGTLADQIKQKGALTEASAEIYIRQVADALDYIHTHNTVHLDIKPSNILINGEGLAVLIDFGISKHYDDDGYQTSTTPVGISIGYAPLEQSRGGEICQFTPSTDIYALGATLYTFVTGKIPPDSAMVLDDGLIRPEGVSDRIWAVIEQSMQTKRKNRPHNITEFLSILDRKPVLPIQSLEKQHKKGDSEPQSILIPTLNPVQSLSSDHRSTCKNHFKAYLLWSMAAVVVIVAIILGFRGRKTIQVTEISLNHKELTLAVGQSDALIAIITPEDAIDKTVKWKSKEPGVATVDGNGIVTAVSIGKTVVGVQTNDGKKVAICSVEVIASNALETPTISSSSSIVGQRVTSTPSGTNGRLDERDTNMTTPTIVEDIPNGSLSVTSVPTGASIWLDGEKTTIITPGVVASLSPGQHSIKLVLDGYQEYDGLVYILSGEREDVTYSLKKKEKPQLALAQGNSHAPAKPTTGMDNGHEWVDLGLSVKWATCNVGASSPNEYGGFYSWGETKTKSEYHAYNLRYCTDKTGRANHFTKYCTSNKNSYWDGIGHPDNKIRLEMTDDAARENWKGHWRMPTKDEWEELASKCSWTWISQDKNTGYLVTGKNGQSIFLPAAGRRVGADFLHAGNYGDYWSSTLNTSLPLSAICFDFGSSFFSTFYYSRSDGFTIRPVTE